MLGGRGECGRLLRGSVSGVQMDDGGRRDEVHSGAERRPMNLIKGWRFCQRDRVARIVRDVGGCWRRWEVAG